jgi:predicted amidohydrolase
MTELTLGVLPWQIGRVAGLEAWTERLDREVAHAAGHGAQVLLMPEYAPLQMAIQPEPDLAAELAQSIALAEAAVQAARNVAIRHGVWLLPGTLPFAAGPAIHNRAPLIAPDGRVAFQDKHVMTRFEAEQWGIQPGRPPCVFDTDWGRIGIAICYDLEFPALVRAQIEAGAWLILAPSCTDTPAGFNRVRIAARARAMENQCFVAVAPTTGLAPWIATLDENRGCAGLYGPVDRGFPDDGVIAEAPMDEGGWLFATLDPTRLDHVRAEGAVRNHRDTPTLPPPCDIAVFA